MEIKLWEGGLQEQEVVAIEKIKSTFKNKDVGKGKLQGGSLREQLSGLKNRLNLMIVVGCIQLSMV